MLAQGTFIAAGCRRIRARDIRVDSRCVAATQCYAMSRAGGLHAPQTPACRVGVLCGANSFFVLAACDLGEDLRTPPKSHARGANIIGGLLCLAPCCKKRERPKRR